MRKNLSAFPLRFFSRLFAEIPFLQYFYSDFVLFLPTTGVEAWRFIVLPVSFDSMIILLIYVLGN